MSLKSILLVEDDELDVISVERSLNKLNTGVHLYTAFNGIEALELLRSKTKDELPELIFLDLNMPRMNGIEFLRELRQDKALKHIKVFVMTTSGEEYDRKETADLGVIDYIIKPLNTDNSKRTSSMDNFMQFYIQKILNRIEDIK